MGLLIFYIALVISVSFICSLLESILLSVGFSHIQQLIKSNVKYAHELKKLKQNIHRPLSAILSLNTIANTLGATGVGAQVQLLYGNEYVTISAAILTFVILIASEIIPKTLGSIYWKKMLFFATYTIKFLIFVFSPFVKLSYFLNKFLGSKQPGVTEEDIIGLSEAGALEGAIYKNESRLIKNILQLNDKFVSQIMTPKTVITAFEENEIIKDIVQKHQPIRFSRIPIYKNNLDDVVGIVHRYKILEAAAQDCDNIPLSTYKKSVHQVPENMSVSAALDQFVKRKEHIFIAVDEYGSVSGLVTMEDVVETILGTEIVDELDSVADMREKAREEWKKRKKKFKKPN